jgi:tRNA modification GTPase
LRQLEGGLAALYEGWRGRLLQALAHLEAEIDFADEDLPAEVAARARIGLVALEREIAAHLDDRRGELLRDGLSVAILGAPNVGKSSLLNALIRREAAIVSSIAGTTRDIVEARLDLDGYPVLLADTAGLREIAAEGDPIEREGVKRALTRSEQADLKLLVYDARASPDAPLAALADKDSLYVANKADLLADAKSATFDPQHLVVSAKSGEGMDTLRRRLAEEAALRMNTTEAPALTRARHRVALQDCRASLLRAIAGSKAELVAEDVRLAARALGRITGRIDVEDLLDVIFRDFCIGK